MGDLEDKACPFCGEIIKAQAVKCHFCREFLAHAHEKAQTTINEQLKKDIELTTYNVLKKDEIKYREHLEHQLAQIKWAASVFIIASLSLFGFFFGKTMIEADDTIKKQVSSYISESSFKEELDDQMKTESKGIIEDATKVIIYAVSAQIDEATKEIIDVVSAQIDEARALNIKDIIKISLENWLKETDKKEFKQLMEIVKPGTIVPYAGELDTVEEIYWLPCDGRSVSRKKYSDLFESIGTAWGRGDGNLTFNIPDLRGQFLRGVDAGSGIDKDASSRTAIKEGGNISDAVGSKQYDSTKVWLNTESSVKSDGTPHPGKTLIVDHVGHVNAYAGDPNAGWKGTSNSAFDSNYGNARETRPRNVAVNYIIKY